MNMNGPPKFTSNPKGEDPKTLAQIEQEKQEVARDAELHNTLLARELSVKPEGFPFPGIDPEALEKIKLDQEQDAAFFDEHPELRPTPIEELIEKLKGGIKVVFPEGNLRSRDVFILPKGSDDITADGLLPRHLQITDAMDSKLKELILSGKEYKKKG